MEGRCRRKYKEVEKERSPERSVRNSVFQMTNLAFPAVTSSKSETSVSDKFNDHSYHALICKNLKQLGCEAKIP